MYDLVQKNKFRRSFYDWRPEAWFVKELLFIDLALTVKWGKWVDRWIIYSQDEPSHIVENSDGTFRPLDQRILRKLRFDHLLTYNDDALEAYLENDAWAMAHYVQRGFEGIRDYLDLKVAE